MSHANACWSLMLRIIQKRSTTKFKVRQKQLKRSPSQQDREAIIPSNKQKPPLPDTFMMTSSIQFISVPKDAFVLLFVVVVVVWMYINAFLGLSPRCLIDWSSVMLVVISQNWFDCLRCLHSMVVWHH